MSTTFKKITTIDVGAGGASSMDFTSIPSTYTGSGLTSNSAGWFNEGAVNSAGSTGGFFSSLDIYIPSYTSSNRKAFSAEFIAIEISSTCYEICTAGWWTGTSAISSIKLFTDAGQTWSQYSSAILYGIKNS